MIEQQQIPNEFKEGIRERMFRMASGWIALIVVLVGVYMLVDKHLQFFHDREVMLIGNIQALIGLESKK